MKNNKKLVRITTVPISLEKLLEHQLRFMSSHYEVTAISSDESWLKRIGEKEGVDTYAVEMSRQITPVADVKALWRLYRFLKKEKPFIVHSHTPKAGVVGMMAAKLAGVPIRLHTVAGLPLMEVTGKRRKLLNFVEKLTYSCATKVYPNSKGLEKIILSEGFSDSNKLKVLGNGSSNGINTQFFSKSHYSAESLRAKRDVLGITASDLVFIFVGRLVGDKGVNELVSAFKKLNDDFPETKLLLVGPLEPELDSIAAPIIEEIERNPSIISVGYQADVRPYLAIANALAFPSYREGFPNAVMQAGAMGLPSIVTDINGCNEIIIEGENGIIIPPKNAEALKRAMQSLLENPELRQRLAGKARPLIVSRYEQKLVWAAILQEYKSLEQNV